MFTQQKPLSSKLSVYTWNPVWDIFQHLTLEEKISEFEIFVAMSQKHFYRADNKEPDSLCLIIAPDLIFAPKDDIDPTVSPIYLYSDKEYLENRLFTLIRSLHTHVLVIAGTIVYATQAHDKYKISSFVLSIDGIQIYDKKFPTTAKHMLGQKELPMESGNTTSVIKFNGRRIGLEICQDHEMKSLQSEIGINNCVDIHVLLSAGQNIRISHICSFRHDRDGVFIQCERRPGRVVKINGLDKIYGETSAYFVKNQIQYLDISNAHNTRNRFIDKISLPTNKMFSKISLQTISSAFIDYSKGFSISSLHLGGLDTNIKLIRMISKICDDSNWKHVSMISDKPDGVERINLLCLNYAKSKNVIDDIQAFAKQWSIKTSLLRSPLTDKFYELLSSEKLTIDDLEKFHYELSTINSSLSFKKS